MCKTCEGLVSLEYKVIRTELPSSELVDARKLEQLLSYENLVTSYKIYWFLGIYKEIILGNKKITFKRVVCRMIANAWYPLLQYHLSFGYFDKLHEAVSYINSRYGFGTTVNENDIVEILENDDDKELNKKLKEFYNMVPYRLISPFFTEQVSELKGHQKNRLIEKLSNENNGILYKIIRENKKLSIVIDDSWFNYIFNNQAIVKGWVNYKLLYFLQKKNQNVPAILLKLEPPFKRDLSRSKDLWRRVVNENLELVDIYIKQSFTNDNFKKYGQLSIDHFIPWSFVMHDEIWNLIPTFKNINSKKNNNLVPINKYMEKFCDMQFLALNTLIKSKLKKDKFMLEEYQNTFRGLNISGVIEGREKLHKESFFRCLKETIQPLYQIAHNQGYEVKDITL